MLWVQRTTYSKVGADRTVVRHDMPKLRIGGREGVSLSIGHAKGACTGKRCSGRQLDQGGKGLAHLFAADDAGFHPGFVLCGALAVQHLEERKGLDHDAIDLDLERRFLVDAANQQLELARVLL